MKPISVKDALPPPNTYVLAYFVYERPDNFLCRNRWVFAEISCGHWRPEGGNGNFDEHVTHWVPMLEVPEGACWSSGTRLLER
jgi:hypothetical protein